MDSQKKKQKRSKLGVVVLFLAGSMLYLELFIQPACSNDPAGVADAASDSANNGPDAKPLDAQATVDAAPSDGAIDGAAIDGAPIDASIDGFTVDATVIDAGVDASLDAPPDA